MSSYSLGYIAGHIGAELIGDSQYKGRQFDRVDIFIEPSI
jgi:hypothetical protein